MNLKSFKTIGLLVLAVFYLTNCKHSAIEPPVQPISTCAYQAYESGDGSRQEYEYNAAGDIIKMTMVLRPGDAGPQVYVYRFTYNNNRQIIGAAITLNGRTPLEVNTNGGVGDAVTFRWEGNRLVEAVDLLRGKAILTTTIQYDPQGRIVHMKGDADLAGSDSFEKTFTYQPNGDWQYKYLNKETGIEDYYEETRVNNTIKHGQSLLAAHGLPFDVFYAHPWNEYAYTDVNEYDVDAKGRRTLIQSIKVDQLVKNGHDMLLSHRVSLDGKTRTATFNIVGCD